jgi:hypothetical protein
VTEARDASAAAELMATGAALSSLDAWMPTEATSPVPTLSTFFDLGIAYALYIYWSAVADPDQLFAGELEFVQTERDQTDGSVRTDDRPTDYPSGWPARFQVGLEGQPASTLGSSSSIPISIRAGDKWKARQVEMENISGVVEDSDRLRAVAIVILIEEGVATRTPDGEAVSVDAEGEAWLHVFREASSRDTAEGRAYDSLLKEVQGTGKLRMPVTPPWDSFVAANSLAEACEAVRLGSEELKRQLQILVTTRVRAAAVIERFIDQAYEGASSDEGVAIPSDVAWAICAHAVVSESGLLTADLEAVFLDFVQAPSAAKRELCEVRLETVLTIEPILGELVDRLHESYFSRDSEPRS